MSALRIYADFNGLVRGCSNPERTAVVLDTFGSLRDLSNAGVVLQPGLPLIAVDWSDEDEDLEGHGTAQYDPANRRWLVEFDEQGVRYVPAGDRTAVRAFLCLRCRVDLQLPTAGPWPSESAVVSGATALNVSATCPSCGTSLLTPFDPPAPE